jgi:hypothetical protein
MSIDFDNIQEITKAQQLKAVRLAIASVELGGQAVLQNGKSVTRAALGTLYAREKELEQQVADEEAGENGGGIVLAQFRDPA